MMWMVLIISGSPWKNDYGHKYTDMLKYDRKSMQKIKYSFMQKNWIKYVTLWFQYFKKTELKMCLAFWNVHFFPIIIILSK